MSIVTIDWVGLFGPGDRARFKVAHDITFTVLATIIYGPNEVYYRVAWIDSAKRQEEQVTAHEVEAAP